jgi:hypothetical protein
MKKYIAIAVLMLGTLANASGTLKVPSLKSDCNVYIAVEDNGKTTFDSAAQVAPYNRCLGYVKGMADEMAGEIFIGTVGTPSGTVYTGQWNGSGDINQVIRVFVKYVNEHPDMLDKEISLVFRTSVDSIGLYTYTKRPKSIVPSDN